MADGPRDEASGVTRRDANWMILKAAAAAGGAAFFSTWLQAAHGPMSSGAPPDTHNWSAYKPQFFPEQDFRNLDAFTAVLIPADDTPGAREACVAQFIDFVVNAAAEYAPEMQERWGKAMTWLRSQAFADLAPPAQIALMERMAAPERDASLPHSEDFRNYKLIKEMTVHAFYTSRVGLIDVLEYKGLAYLTEFPACTHPEHHRI